MSIPMAVPRGAAVAAMPDRYRALKIAGGGSAADKTIVARSRGAPGPKTVCRRSGIATTAVRPGQAGYERTSRPHRSILCIDPIKLGFMRKHHRPVHCLTNSIKIVVMRMNFEKGHEVQPISIICCREQKCVVFERVPARCHIKGLTNPRVKSILSVEPYDRRKMIKRKDMPINTAECPCPCFLHQAKRKYLAPFLLQFPNLFAEDRLARVSEISI